MSEKRAESRPEISVIVPVYKVERYLNECIDSILAQTFTDFELILVDDGSPRQEALVNYEIDEYDERFLRHLALGYTKEQITNLRGMPFGVKSLEKRQAELVQKLFPDGNHGMGINATRLVVKACELRILDIDHLQADEE